MQKEGLHCRPRRKEMEMLGEDKHEISVKNNMTSEKQDSSHIQGKDSDNKANRMKREVLLEEDNHDFYCKNYINTEKNDSSQKQRKEIDCWPKLMEVVPLHDDKYSSSCKNNADKKQSSHMQNNSLDCRPEQKVRGMTLYEEDETSDTHSSILSSICEKKHNNTMIKLKNVQLNMRCEWQDCDFCTTNLNHFVQHVSFHIPQLEVKENNEQEDVYACLWESCGFHSSDSKEIIRHVNFHSFHTKIKCIGSYILAQSGQPACTYVQVGKNQIPNLPHVFACCWDDCERTFNNSQMFFHHVQTHVYHNPRGHNVAGGVPCGWHGCDSMFRSVYKLEEHVRKHTQEKLVGCPTCGGLFANKVKFLDHCKRQVPVELQGYQCSHCGKCFTCKRLLTDHISHHMNNHQCFFCDMTCSSPSGLAVHIRYKHIDCKPFKCHTCDYAAKTQYDMNNHLTTHSYDPLHCCKEEGCDFSFRSAYGLHRHYRRYHCGENEPTYCCHICDDLFQRGSLLSYHLMNKHNICRPSGHSRFRYKLEHDGYFRLQTAQTVHFRASSSRPLCSTSRYNLHQLSDRSFEITISEDEKNTKMKKAKT